MTHPLPVETIAVSGSAVWTSVGSATRSPSGNLSMLTANDGTTERRKIRWPEEPPCTAKVLCMRQRGLDSVRLVGCAGTARWAASVVGATPCGRRQAPRCGTPPRWATAAPPARSLASPTGLRVLALRGLDPALRVRQKAVSPSDGCPIARSGPSAVEMVTRRDAPRTGPCARDLSAPARRRPSTRRVARRSGCGGARHARRGRARRGPPRFAPP